MGSNLHFFLPWLSSFICLCAGVYAQVAAPPYSFGAELGGVRGMAHLDGAVVEWQATEQVSRLTLPVRSLTCGCRWGDSIAVYGIDANGHGQMFRIVSNGRQLVVASRERTFNNVGAVIIDNANSDLFLVDADSGEIRCAPIGVGLPDMSAFTHVATLPGAAPRSWAHPRGGIGVGQELLHVWIRRMGTAWQQETIDQRGLRVALNPVGRLGCSGAVRIRSGAPGELSLVARRVELPTIQLGNATKGVHEYELPNGETLDPSTDYQLVLRTDGGIARSAWITPQVSLGRRIAVGAQQGTINVDLSDRSVFVGSNSAAVAGRVLWQESPPRRAELVCWLRIADAGAPIPTKEIGNLAAPVLYFRGCQARPRV